MFYNPKWWLKLRFGIFLRRMVNMNEKMLVVNNLEDKIYNLQRFSIQVYRENIYLQDILYRLVVPCFQRNTLKDIQNKLMQLMHRPQHWIFLASILCNLMNR